MTRKVPLWHVVHNPGGGWSVKKEGALRASRTFSDRSIAIDYARRRCSGLYVHDVAGKVCAKLEEEA